MAAHFLATILLAGSNGGGLLFTFEHSTLPGKTIMLLLFVGSIYLTVMVTGFRIIAAQRQRDSFLECFPRPASAGCFGSRPVQGARFSPCIAPVAAARLPAS
jgi:hypothetical protein